jgi:hypothetical protein
MATVASTASTPTICGARLVFNLRVSIWREVVDARFAELRTIGEESLSQGRPKPLGALVFCSDRSVVIADCKHLFCHPNFGLHGAQNRLRLRAPGYDSQAAGARRHSGGARATQPKDTACLRAGQLRLLASKCHLRRQMYCVWLSPAEPCDEWESKHFMRVFAEEPTQICSMSESKQDQVGVGHVDIRIKIDISLDVVRGLGQGSTRNTVSSS